MSRKTCTVSTGIVIASLIALAFIRLPAALHGDDIRRSESARNLIVHEWGTFTSIAGSDGTHFEFRPLVANDLPSFVSRADPSELFSKPFVARQRMETPVTYFYTDAPRTVNVRVDFPEGMLTEWYPVVKQFESGKATAGRAMGRAYLDWGPVRLTPAKQFADVRVRDSLGQPMPASFPPVAADDHYGRARDTDSAIVETLDAAQGSHFEKFLFYRGVGNFELPITLVARGRDQFEVTNCGDNSTGALFLVRIERERVRYQRIGPLGPAAVLEITLPSAETTIDALAEAMVRELCAAGLYEKEAKAMVSTWRTSWFGENGTRLLYLVPQALTDKLLPLSIDPAPSECVRILVGRLETITPEDCQRLTQALVGNGDESPKAETVKAELDALGRFSEPAVQLLISRTTDPKTRSRLEAILVELRAPSWGL